MYTVQDFISLGADSIFEVEKEGVRNIFLGAEPNNYLKLMGAFFIMLRNLLFRKSLGEYAPVVLYD